MSEKNPQFLVTPPKFQPTLLFLALIPPAAHVGNGL